MKCPACGCRNVHCKDSRYREAQDCRWRRYLCESCGTRFTLFDREKEGVGTLTELRYLGRRVGDAMDLCPSCQSDLNAWVIYSKTGSGSQI